MCVATFIGSGVATLSDASAVRTTAISGFNGGTVPMASTVRALSRGVGVRVPLRAIRVSATRVSGEAPPQPLVTRVSVRPARNTQVERVSTMALGGKRSGPCESACTMESRPQTPKCARVRHHRQVRDEPRDGGPGADPATLAHRSGSSGPPGGPRAAAEMQSSRRVFFHLAGT